MNTDQRPGGISGHGPGIPAGVRITSFRPGAVSIEAVAAIENDEVSHQGPRGGDDQDQDQDHDKQETTSHEAGADDSAGLTYCEEHETMETSIKRTEYTQAETLEHAAAIIAEFQDRIKWEQAEHENKADIAREHGTPEDIDAAASLNRRIAQLYEEHNHAEDIRRRILFMAGDLRQAENEQAEHFELYQDQRNNIMREHDKANRAVYDAIIQTNTTTSTAYADAYETRAELEAELAALDREAVERGLIPDPEETTTSEPTAYEENARDENNRRREWTAYEAE